MKFLSVVYLLVILISSPSLAKEVGLITCTNVSKRVIVQGTVFGSSNEKSYAKLYVAYKNGTVAYLAKLVPRTETSFFLTFASDQNGGLVLDIYADDMGLMSSLKLGSKRPIELTCGYLPL